MIKYIYLIYSEIWGKIYNSPDFNLPEKKRNKKIIDNFLTLLNKEIGLSSIGKDWIYNYTIYQFNKYKDIKTSHSIQPNWIYGKKAFERWKNRNEFADHWIREFAKQYELTPPEQPIESSNTTYKLMERKRFYGQEMGFYHCQSLELNTSEKNKECRFCKNKKRCY